MPGPLRLQAGEICAGLAPTPAVTANAENANAVTATATATAATTNIATAAASADNAATDQPRPGPATAIPAQSPSSASAFPLPAWGCGVLFVSAGGLLVEGMLHGLHGGGSWLGLGALAGGWWWLARSRVGGGLPPRPTSVAGWSARCQSLLGQFIQFDAEPLAQHRRAQALTRLLAERERQELRVALVSSDPPGPSMLPAVQNALRASRPLRLLVSHPLPSRSERWQWSEGFTACDALIFHLRPPLTAADLRWLEALPAGLPIWLLVQAEPHRSSTSWMRDLHSQWPASASTPILSWTGDADGLATSLAPLSAWLGRDSARLLRATLLRNLESLHQSWQADLERLRREQWRQLQQRTQWLVAAGVLVTPSFSVDLLVITVANGLMLREMARLWDCPWTLEQLRGAATLVGQAALGLGVVEWSTQAVCAAFKLHGSTWLVGGTLQALSAAYLTRVVGHAMADLLARGAGVSAPDLEAIKAEAPLLVARAAEAERLDWGSFLQEARAWLRQQEPGAAPSGSGAGA
ncbi:MAG: YcjF family protein [Cyanobacteriota bacterium]|nr:YcjF family protein [Cyanobacteriota bacterium]